MDHPTDHWIKRANAARRTAATFLRLTSNRMEAKVELLRDIADYCVEGSLENGDYDAQGPEGGGGVDARELAGGLYELYPVAQALRPLDKGLTKNVFNVWDNMTSRLTKETTT